MNKIKFKAMANCLRKMIDLRVGSGYLSKKGWCTAHDPGAIYVTKEELTDMIDAYQKLEYFTPIAVYDDRLDRSETFCNQINNTTIAFSVMMDTNKGYCSSWEFKVILN